MGRRKITIKQISDPKLRHITFNKRKNGLIKKAAELSVLCNVNMLLVFEDGEGNLIQFSKNRISNLADFHQECRYTNLLDFTAKDYPCFFKVNHYKKHKKNDVEDYGDDDDDELEYQDEMDEKSPLYGQSEHDSRLYNKERLPVSKHLKEEEPHSGNMLYQPPSGGSENDLTDNLNNYNDIQARNAQMNQLKNKAAIKPKVNVPKVDDKQRLYTNPTEQNLNMMNDQDINQTQKDQFQNFKGQLTDYQNAYGNFDNSFKPANQLNNQQMPFRYYPTEANKNPNLNLQNINNPGFTNASKLPNNLQNMPNMPFMNNTITNINNINNINAANSSNITPTNANNLQNNNQAYKPVQNIPNNYSNNAAAQALAGFAANMNIQGMSNMANIANMGNIKNTDALNAMLKGLPSLGFAIGGANPFMQKTGAKPEVDDKMAGIDKANMMKYFSNTAAAQSAANNYSMPKMYNFHANEGDKVNDAGNYYQMRKDGDGNNYDLGQEFDEAAQFARGDYRFDQSLPANLPSAYFGSKKSNFDGFFGNANFNEEKFNELADSKKKTK